MTEREDENRVASGWGRREPKPSQRDWVGGESGQPDPAEPAEDAGLARDAGPITGRESTRTPQEMAPGDTLGGTPDTDATDDAGTNADTGGEAGSGTRSDSADRAAPPDGPDANMSQADPL